MKKYKLLGIYFTILSLAIAEETVLIPTDDGGYKRVAVSEVVSERAETVKKLEEIEKIKREESVYTREELAYQDYHEKEKEPLTIEDFLKVSINYEDKKFDKKSLRDNKNSFQNRIASDFISNSKMDKKITEDLYMITIDAFGERTTYEGDSKDTDSKNYGIIAGIQYGYTDNLNSKLNLGYSKSKYQKEKADNIYISLDLNYSEYGDYDWEIGTVLGYMNGEHKNYKVDDMFIGVLYGKIAVPVAETIKVEGIAETTILSNKIGLGIKKEIEFDEKEVKIDLGISSEYIFGYKDREKKIYTYLDEKKPTVQIEAKINTEKFDIVPYYEVLNNSAGIKIQYRF